MDMDWWIERANHHKYGWVISVISTLGLFLLLPVILVYDFYKFRMEEWMEEWKSENCIGKIMLIWTCLFSSLMLYSLYFLSAIFPCGFLDIIGYSFNECMDKIDFFNVSGYN